MPQAAFVPPQPLLHRPTAPGLRCARRHVAAPPPRAQPRRHRARIVSAATPDYYAELGVARDADHATVKRAYRRAALKNHPDVSSAPDAQERFLRVQEAYAVLSDRSKRAAYDRRSRFADAAASVGASWTPPAAGAGFDPEEYVRRWRESNPMPQDINDSFGSIFTDLFSGVADAVGSKEEGGAGLMDDFVEFLEKQVDGFGVNASGYASDESDDGLEAVLQSSDVDVLQAEIDDARFVLEQLRVRRTKLEDEERSLRDRADEWRARADRADRSKDYMTRDAARDREADLRIEAKRFSVRARKTQSHIEKQQQRIRRIQRRLDDVKRQSGDSAEASKATTTTVDSKASEKQEIDEELERMKKELGL